MPMLRALAVVAFATTCLVTSPAGAQRLRPTAREWRTTEATLRAHYAGRTILDVRRMDTGAMGTTFWVRFQVDGGPVGQVVAVRGTEVLDGHGDDGVRAILRADRFVETRSWTPADLLSLITQLGGTLPHADTSLVGDVRTGVLTPRITAHDASGVTLVYYAHRHWGPPEAPARPHYYVTKCTLRIDASYALTWSTENVVLDAPLPR